MISLDGLGAGSSLQVELIYLYYPPEAPVRYYPDGTGNPGSPAWVQLIGAHVRCWDVMGEIRPRTDHWLWQMLDEIAINLVEKNWEHFEDVCLQHARSKFD